MRLLAFILLANGCLQACGSGNESSGDDGRSDVTCSDSVLNGTETDVDCGGDACDPCETGSACIGNSDCASNYCSNDTCTAAACNDSVKNGTETDVDCGGDCALNQDKYCAYGKACEVALDCGDHSVGCVDDLCVTDFFDGELTLDENPYTPLDDCWPDGSTISVGLNSFSIAIANPGITNPIYSCTFFQSGGVNYGILVPAGASQLTFDIVANRPDGCGAGFDFEIDAFDSDGDGWVSDKSLLDIGPELTTNINETKTIELTNIESNPAWDATALRVGFSFLGYVDNNNSSDPRCGGLSLDISDITWVFAD